jgi:hypothetical protein
MSEARELKARIDRIADTRHVESSVAPIYLGRVFTEGGQVKHRPQLALTRPLEIVFDGDPVVGSEPELVPDETAQEMVFVLGGTVPRIGSNVLAFRVDGLWVAERAGIVQCSNPLMLTVSAKFCSVPLVGASLTIWKVTIVYNPDTDLNEFVRGGWSVSGTTDSNGSMTIDVSAQGEGWYEAEAVYTVGSIVLSKSSFAYGTCGPFSLAVFWPIGEQDFTPDRKTFLWDLLDLFAVPNDMVYRRYDANNVLIETRTLTHSGLNVWSDTDVAARAADCGDGRLMAAADVNDPNYGGMRGSLAFAPGTMSMEWGFFNTYSGSTPVNIIDINNQESVTYSGGGAYQYTVYAGKATLTPT